MARLAFFTERLPPANDPIARFSYELIQSLADQQHDVRVFSTYREGEDLPPAHPRIEIIRPFKHWSWLELPRLLPLLLEFRPEILHLIQPRAEALGGMTNAMSGLAGFVPLLGGPAVVTSFYDLRDGDLRTHRIILHSSDVVTVSTDPQLSLLQRHLERISRATKISVLPVPAVGVQRDSMTESASLPPQNGIHVALAPESVLSLQAKFPDWIFIPGDVSEHFAADRLFDEIGKTLRQCPDVAIVIGGGWGSIPIRTRHALMKQLETQPLGARLLLTGPVEPEAERWLLANSRVTFLASLPAESLGLARILRLGLEVSAPLILSEEQALTDALSWRHGENAVIAGAGPRDWSRAMIESLTVSNVLDEIRARLPEFSRAEAVDQPANVMSRLYAELLDRRRHDSHTR